MAEVIKFETSLKEFSLNEQTSVFFNPTDMVFIERVFSTVEKLGEVDETYNAALDKIDDNAAVFDLARAHDEEIRAELNSLFGKDICTPVFGEMSVSAIADGFPVWANLLFAVIDTLDEAFLEEKKKTNPRLAKYTAKYSSRNRKKK